MLISLASSGIDGFRKWSRERPPTSNDNDNPGGATPIALAKAPSDSDTAEDLPHRPWVIPGVGDSF